MKRGLLSKFGDGNELKKKQNHGDDTFSDISDEFTENREELMRRLDERI